jgi:EAL domain-containing protein (putative c-di-GMP-specific phosphodiesterase class I)
VTSRRLAACPQAGDPAATEPCALFVDDEASVRAGVALTMRHSHCRIVTAGSGPEALDILEREPVTVVVSDENMPVMSGTAFLSTVRDRHPDVVRMILSGSMDPHSISRAVNEAGVFRYLLKPCSPDELRLAVDQAIEAHAGHQTPPPPTASRISVDEGLGDFRMVMQPIYTCRRGRLYAHEALLRLPHHPEATVGDLLDEATRQNRLWELERAIRGAVAARMWERPHGSRLFVNLHPNSLMDPQIYTTADPLAPYAPSVVLEITERGSLEDVSDLRERVAALRGLGYRIAIDDMGSGYSGLTTFTAVLPDFVKFDRELIRAMHATPAKRKLVSSIARVCRELHIATIAEGIEGQPDLAAARAIGCTMVQGYLLGTPEPEFRQGQAAEWIA